MTIEVPEYLLWIIVALLFAEVILDIWILRAKIKLKKMLK